MVARTATSSGATPSAAASRSRIASPVRREPRLLADQDDVRVRELPAGGAHMLPRLPQQLDGVGAGERRIPGGEERADVLEARGAEHRVGERVREHVAVGVAGEPARMVDPDAAEHERHAVLERVRVDAGADPVLGHGSRSGSSASESTRSRPRARRADSPHGPRRTWTATIPAASAGSTSLSTRSPTYATSSGDRPASAAPARRIQAKASRHPRARTRRRNRRRGRALRTRHGPLPATPRR